MSETPPPVAFLDANVLYPALSRNLFMYFALGDLFRPRWSARVHEEWIAALLRDRPDISRAQLERTRSLMEAELDDALVEDYEPLVESLALPDAKDLHVLAAAIHCRAECIVTLNLRDFPGESLAAFDLVALHSDTFLSRLAKKHAEEARAAFLALCAERKRPYQPPQEVLALLRGRGFPATADALSALLA